MTIQTKMWVSFVSVATVIVVAGILGITEINRLYAVAKDISMIQAPLADATKSIQLHTTKATRWFEEIMAEVEEEEELIDDVWGNLEDALSHVDSILEGGTNDNITISPITDPAIKVHVLSLKSDLEIFITLTHLRFDNRATEEEEELDEQYDALFDKMMIGAENIEIMIRANMTDSLHNMKIVALRSTLILTIATVLSFLIATLSIYYLSSEILTQVGGEPAEIAKITQEVAKGNLDIEFDSKTSTGIYAAVKIMVTHLKTMKHKLKQQMVDIREQEWLQTGQAKLNEKMSGGLDIVMLADNVISYLSSYLKADVGVFYLQKEKNELHIISSYGYTQKEKTVFKFGDGLVGQVALKKEMLSCNHTPEEANLIIQSGLAVAVPHHVILFPILYENALKGVIEFGFSDDVLTTVQNNFIQKIIPSIGIAVNTAQSRSEMHLLLKDSWEKTEELQSNAEELQAQQEELRQINEELEERTHELERQPKLKTPFSPQITEPTNENNNLISANEQVILIIEDDPIFVQILIVLAQKRHFKTIVAEDGETGLQLAQQYLPNIIILDIGLPDMDGWTVIERLKENPKTRHIPVQFISAQGDPLTAKKLGAVGYLQKPALPDQIGNAFEEIEQFVTKSVKTVLILVENNTEKQPIVDLVGAADVQITQAETRREALKQLQLTQFDCIVIDIDVEDSSGLKLLEPLYNDNLLSKIPVIVYMSRDLSSSEDILLQQAMERITVKTVRSQEHLLDETTLFLHQESAKLSKEKQEMLHHIHDQHKVLKNRKVLIVDDDARNSFALTTVLENHDMIVSVAYNGHEALSSLADVPEIDLVIMDIMMPEMDGYETMQKIRQDPRFEKLPIIALTAKSMKDDKAKCLEAGANDYLSKPLDTDKLLSLMRMWLYQ